MASRTPSVTLEKVDTVSGGNLTADLHPATFPVLEKKRKASYLGEQERRERKRAVDREAQRTLREKTRLHIANLERTIETLRNQDINGTTAALLDQIDGLRKENERLRGVIENVRIAITLGAGDPVDTPTPTTNGNALR